MHLQQFDFELKYLQGKGSNAADYLPRQVMPCSQKKQEMSGYRERVVKAVVNHHTLKAMALRNPECNGKRLKPLNNLKHAGV